MMSSPFLSLSAHQLENVTGGAAKPPRKLKVRKVGNVKVLNNQSDDDMFWELKPQ